MKLLDHSHLERFCIFIGYPRSGHSLVGSILDAHPDAIISHEFHALECFAIGMEPSQIFSGILKKAKLFNQSGRSWFGYNYKIDERWHGRARQLRVLGDKQGGKTNKLLGTRPDLLASFKSSLPIPLRVIHVLRNPFDMLSTQSRRSGLPLEVLVPRFFQKFEISMALRANSEEREWLDFHHEDLLKTPGPYLHRLLDFLSLGKEQAHLEACARCLFPKPRVRRNDVPWSPSLVEEVEVKCRSHPLLRRYRHE